MRRAAMLVVSVAAGVVAGTAPGSARGQSPPVRTIRVGQTVILRTPAVEPGDSVACRIAGRTVTTDVPPKTTLRGKSFLTSGGKDVLTPVGHSLELAWLSRRLLRFSCT
jgi:hypothetical protein